MKKKEERARTPFGQRMLVARNAAKLGQVQAAKQVGISQSTLAGLEREAHKSGYTVKFAKIYGCNPEWLADGEGEGPSDLPSSVKGKRRHEPAKPDYTTRPLPTDSDWDTVEDIKVLPTDEQEELRKTLKARADKFRAYGERAIEQAKLKGGS